MVRSLAGIVGVVPAVFFLPTPVGAQEPSAEPQDSPQGHARVIPRIQVLVGCSLAGHHFHSAGDGFTAQYRSARRCLAYENVCHRQLGQRINVP